MSEKQPGRLRLDPGEINRLHTIAYGRKAAYTHMRQAYDQAVASLRDDDDADTVDAFAAALALAVTGCRRAIADADATRPVVVPLARPWRPWDGPHAG